MRHPEWSSSAVIYEMNIRQLTPEGSIRAAIDRLDFLRKLGIDIIWLMPIYPIGEEDRKGSLGSYYSIRDYCGVNEEFGTLEDFDAFLATAHKLGMRVILDWVANHTSRDARWIDERPADWYERDEAGRALVPWDWSDTAKLNYSNHEVWRGQIDAMRYWIERGVDGFRCDMAMLVPIEFWNEVGEELRSVREDIFMLAEAEETNLFEGAFNACYGWEMHHLMCDVAQGRARADAIRDLLYRDRGYPRWSIPMMFTSNHDENSWQGTEQERFGDALWVMTLFTFVAPQGMPLIYTGQEVGYEHSFEFFDADPIPESLYRDDEMTDLYSSLSRLKHSFSALRAGDESTKWCTISNNAEDCLLILVRDSIRDRVVSIMNLSPYPIEAHYNMGMYAGDYVDWFSGENRKLTLSNQEIIGGWEFRVLTKTKSRGW